MPPSIQVLYLNLILQNSPLKLAITLIMLGSDAKSKRMSKLETRVNSYLFIFFDESGLTFFVTNFLKGLFPCVCNTVILTTKLLVKPLS